MRGNVASVLLGICALMSLLSISEGCMCMASHPQSDICRETSFVALVKIRSEAYIHVADDTKKNSKMKTKNAGMIQPVATRLHEDDNEVEEKTEPKIIPTASSRDIILDDMYQEKRDVASFIRYRVKIAKVFKGFTTEGAKRRKFYIYSPPHEGMCGRRFTVKEMYLIIGSVVDGRLMVGACSHVIPWKYFPRSQRRNVRKNMIKATAACKAGCSVSSCMWSSCELEQQKPKECVWSGIMERKYASKYDRANFVCTPNARGRCNWSGATLKKRGRRRRRRHRTDKRRHEFLKTLDHRIFGAMDTSVP